MIVHLRSRFKAYGFIFFRPLAVPFVKIFFASQTDRSGSAAFGGGTPPASLCLALRGYARSVYRSGSVDWEAS